MWLLLAAVAMLLRRVKNPLLWATVSGFFGLMFGALCAPVYIFVGGLGFAVSWWISGIPFDLMHCAGNFAMALVLFMPLRRLLDKLYRK
jgi:energy-coupling factor transport system substrate-specific component